MKKLLRRIGMAFFFSHHLRRFQWYRRWHGGRWERWYIELCHAILWLDIPAWYPDDHRQPCSEGARIAREDWE